MADRRHPVIEIFGPTVQGEGPDAGQPCHFVRFGGCDYRCEWCDSMHAVDPQQVRENSTRLTALEIADQLSGLPTGPGLVILSGGNPALHDLTDLVAELHRRGWLVSVETQGSRWKPWLFDCDRLVISPKPPSSGMATTAHAAETSRFLTRVVEIQASHPTFHWAASKIVVDDAADLEWVTEYARGWPQLPLYVSLCTRPDDTPTDLGDRLAELYDAVCRIPELAHARVLPQLHVIAWGHKAGV